MLRMILIIGFCSITTLGVLAQSGPTTLTVEAYVGVKGLVHHYDSQGARIGTMAIADLPPAGTTVVDEAGTRVRYKVETGKGPVWLAASSVKVKEKLTLATDCEKLNRLQGAQPPQRSAASRGLAECKE